jgi:conjugal transfer pilin signal peptidase TrbI
MRIWNRSPQSRAVDATEPRRMTWAVLGMAIFQAVLVVALMQVGLLWVHHGYYWIAVDPSAGERCLVPRWFLVDMRAHHVGRGDYVVFRSRGMKPFYPDGTPVLKLIAGVPGDHIVVNATGVWVNEVRWGDLRHAQTGGRLWALGRHPDEFVRDERVPPHHWWVLGTNARSFDSRYWGYIDDSQIIGRARPLW